MTDALRDRLRITVSGAGQRTIVLGNGFGTTQAAWQRLLPWLEERARVVRFDWPTDPGHYDHHRYSSLDAYASDLRDRLEGFTVPTTIIRSTHDPAVPVTVADYLHRHWPNSDVVTIEASGHLPHLTAAPRLKEALAPLLP